MRTPDHVIAEINYRAGGPSTEAPTTCTCGWEGPGSAFAEHRTKATAEDRRAAKEGRTMTPAGPTEKQQQAWDLVTKEGLSQVEAADALGITQGGLQSRLKGYMENQGMKGPLPGLGGAGNGPVRIRRVPPEVLDGPVTTSAPEASSAGAVQAASMGGDAVEPDEGAAPQPPDPTSSDPEPVAETVPSAAGDGATVSLHLVTRRAIATELWRLDQDIERLEAEAQWIAQRLGRLAEARQHLKAAHDALVALEDAA